MLATFVLLAQMLSLASCDKNGGAPLEEDGLVPEVFIGRSFGSNGSKGAVDGKSFPAGVYEFSFVVLKSDKVTSYGTGYNNVKAELTIEASGAQQWRYQLAGSSTWLTKLVIDIAGKGDVWVAGVYPYSATAPAVAAGGILSVPFDLTAAAQVTNQSDLMFSEPSKVTYSHTGGSKSVIMTFSHFYALLEFDIAPIFIEPSKITKVSVTNNTGKTFLKAKGTAVASSPVAINSAVAGTVASDIADAQNLEMDVYTKIWVMVPPMVDAFTGYTDGDIVVNFTDGVNEVVSPQPFPIKSEWLATTEGLKSGKKYSFKIAYLNDATGRGALELQSYTINDELDSYFGNGPQNPTFPNPDWGTGGEDSELGELPPPPVIGYFSGVIVEEDADGNPQIGGGYFGLSKKIVLADTDASANTMAWGPTTALGTNYQNKVSGKNVTLLLMQHTNAAQYLAAKACWDLNSGLNAASTTVETPEYIWYLPAQNELMGAWIANLSNSGDFVAFVAAIYWSASEYSTSTSYAWYVNFTPALGNPYNGYKATPYRVRCIREL